MRYHSLQRLADLSIDATPGHNIGVRWVELETQDVFRGLQEQLEEGGNEGERSRGGEGGRKGEGRERKRGRVGGREGVREREREGKEGRDRGRE